MVEEKWTFSNIFITSFDFVKKYPIKFGDDDNMMAALSSIENNVYRVRQKTNKQQLT
jgi:hypothetical protein